MRFWFLRVNVSNKISLQFCQQLLSVSLDYFQGEKWQKKRPQKGNEKTRKSEAYKMPFFCFLLCLFWVPFCWALLFNMGLRGCATDQSAKKNGKIMRQKSCFIGFIFSCFFLTFLMSVFGHDLVILIIILVLVKFINIGNYAL